MKFVFFGTDHFAVTVLENLKNKNLHPALIVTTPDQARDRHLKLTPPPVKIWAEQNQIPYLQPTKLKEPSLIETLRSETYDFFLVASYGKIIPPVVLSLPAHGVLNIHPSLLPQYRGAAPLQMAILNGDEETGVTIMQVDEEMDHGPILAQKVYPLTPNTTFITLRDDLAQLGVEILAEILPDYLNGKLEAREQDHPAATYTQKITKALGQLDLSVVAEINDRKIRALNPNPGTFWLDQNGKRIKIISAHLADGQLIFDRVIPEGKKEMDWKSYLRGKTN